MREIQASRIAETVQPPLHRGQLRTCRSDMKRRITGLPRMRNVARGAGNTRPDRGELRTSQTRSNVPICQDTGMACVFLEIGQEVYVNGSIEEAVHEGVRAGLYRRAICASPWCAIRWIA